MPQVTEIEKLEYRAGVAGKVIHWVLVLALVTFVVCALAGAGGVAKAVAYIGALGWFLLEWFRGNLFEKANSKYKKELERLGRRVENYETKIRIEQTKFAKKEAH